MKNKKCLDCKKSFITKKVNHIYCSNKCKFRAWAKMNPRVRKESI